MIYSTKSEIKIQNNFFFYGIGTFGAYLDFEYFYKITSENNIFLCGMAITLNTNGITSLDGLVGSGSVSTMTGSTNFELSSYIGINNKYIDGIAEVRGYLK